MANHHITIAKASLAAALLRPDVTNLTRDEISKFHGLLEAVVSKCSPSNIQTCKEWLLEHVISSPQRAGAFCKYLAFFSKHLRDNPIQSLDQDIPTIAIRQRLHILYLLNDLLHHAKFHATGSGASAVLTDGLRPHLSDVFPELPSDGKKRVKQRLQDLLQLWEQESHFSRQTIKELQAEDTQSDRHTKSSATAQQAQTNTKQLPYIMPAHHGDPSTPYHDLPAANLMPHIVPNEPISMRPDQIRALQLSAGPADESLVNAVKDFLRDVERMENPYQTFEMEGIDVDVDEIGNLSYRNETDEHVGDTYYGWSRAFCEKMKTRRQEDGDTNRRGRSDSISRGHSSSRSHSRSFSRSPAKRRRYDQSRSRSQSPHRPVLRGGSHSRQLPRNPSDTRTSFQPSSNGQSQSRAPASASPMTSSFIPPPSLGPDGPLVHPPRPPNYEGVWPPPPPPAPPSGFAPASFTPTPQFYPYPHRQSYPRYGDDQR